MAENDVKILKVELLPQQTDMWCWAASAEMIMKFEGHDVLQCLQANHEFGRNDCCNNPTPNECVQGGWPEFEVWGFSSNKTDSGVALPFDQLQAQIIANMPVWFAWWWTGGGGHAMVVRGYSTSLQTVYINDPWPPNAGDTRWISYSDWVEKSGDHTHAKDFYNIKYAAAGASEEKPAMKPGSSITPPTGYRDAETAAREALKKFPLLVTQDNAKEMGFDSFPVDPANLSLGPPLPIFYIRHDALQGHSVGDDIRKLLNEGEELMFPVIKDGNAVSSVVVAKQEGAWRFRSLGRRNLVRDIVEVRDRLVRGSGKDPSDYFIVRIPSMYQIFIGHYEKKEKLILTHIHDNPRFSFAAQSMQPAEQVIEAILPRAKEGRYGIPEKRRS